MSIPIRKKELIKTERLIIKPYSENDLEDIVNLLTNDGITETFMVPDYETREEFEELAGKLIGFSSLEDTVHLDCGIYLSGHLIGFINDCGIEDDEIEIGYVIHPDYKGHGYATEAVKAILVELRDMGFKTVQAGYFEENTASLRVMEKAGMHAIDYEDSGEYRGEIKKCRYCEISFNE